MAEIGSQSRQMMNTAKPKRGHWLESAAQYSAALYNDHLSVTLSLSHTFSLLSFLSISLCLFFFSPPSARTLWLLSPPATKPSVPEAASLAWPAGVLKGQWSVFSATWSLNRIMAESSSHRLCLLSCQGHGKISVASVVVVRNLLYAQWVKHQWLLSCWVFSWFPEKKDVLEKHNPHQTGRQCRQCMQLHCMRL